MCVCFVLLLGMCECFLIKMMAPSDVVCSGGWDFHIHGCDVASLRGDSMVHVAFRSVAFHCHSDALALYDVPIPDGIRAYDMVLCGARALYGIRVYDVRAPYGIQVCACDILGIRVFCDDLHNVVVVCSVHNDVGLVDALHSASDSEVQTMVCHHMCLELELVSLTQLPIE